MKAHPRASAVIAIGVLTAITVMDPASASASSRTNIVGDGMFTSPKVVPVGAQHNDFCLVPNSECPTSNATIGPWRVTSGSVDLVATGGIWQQPPGAASNAQTIDLNGTQTGALAQTLSTKVGPLYTGTFEFAGNPGSGPTIKTMNVLINGHKIRSYSFNETGWSVSDMGWVKRSFGFVATKSKSVLTFSSTTPNSSYGPVIADVRVVSAP